MYKTPRCGDKIPPAEMQDWGGRGAPGAELLFLLSIPACPLGQAPAPLAAPTGRAAGGELLATSSFSSLLPYQGSGHGMAKAPRKQLDNSRASLSGIFISFIGNFSLDITDGVQHLSLNHLFNNKSEAYFPLNFPFVLCLNTLA